MRYHTIDMAKPEMTGFLLISGPQDESQVCDSVKDLFKKQWIKKVVIVYDHGQGEKATIYQPMPEPKESTPCPPQ